MLRLATNVRKLGRKWIVGVIAGGLMTAVGTVSTIAVELRSSVGERAIQRNVKRSPIQRVSHEARQPEPGEVPALPQEKETESVPLTPAPVPSRPEASLGEPQDAGIPPERTFAAEPYSSEPYYSEYGQGYDDPWMGGYCGPVLCGRRWADLDVLLWWRRGHALPPLATTSPNATPFANAGVLPNATVLFGGEGEGGDMRPGGRVTAGIWFDPCHQTGIGGRFFALGDEQFQFSQSSTTGSPILAIPFFNAEAGLNQEDALVVSYPNAPDVRTGGIAISGTSELLGADAFFRCALYQNGCQRIDFIAGYQHSRIDEKLLIMANSTVPNQFTQDIVDFFGTQNEFHAGTIGWMSECERGCWKLTSLVKIGFGNMSQTATLAGRTDIAAPPGTPAVADNQGLFVRASNRGTYTQNDFAVAPELNVNYVCHVTEQFDVTIGYSFLYWSQVAQPGHLIDRRVDVTGVANLPAFRFATDDYWVSGVNLGAQFRF